MVNTVDIVYCFDQKTDRTDAVAAGNDCTVRILHPSVIEITAAECKHVDIGNDAFPCRLAHALRPATFEGIEHLSLLHVAGMLYLVFILRRKIFVEYFAQNRNLAGFHLLE